MVGMDLGRYFSRWFCEHPHPASPSTSANSVTLREELKTAKEDF